MSKPLNILMIEDSEDDTDLLLRELRRGGYEPNYDRIETAAAMKAALTRQRWDIVIADYRLPHFSAPAALVLLQASGLDLPFIIVSGVIGEEAAVSAMKAGAHDYLMKGRLARLIPAIERELREVEIRRDHRQMAQALADREKHFRALIEHATDIITLVDAQDVISYTSPAITRILGYPPTEFLGLKATHFCHPDDLPEIKRLADHLRRQPEVSLNTEFRFQHKDGSWHWLEASVTNLLAEPGVQAIVINARDITVRKQAEVTLQQTMADLARSNADLEQFAYAASHDLQEPLRGIAGTVQLLQRRYRGQLDVRADEFIEHAVENVSRMQTLISDLLTFSRVGTRRQAFQPVDCSVLLAHVKSNLTAAIAENGACITYDALPTIRADPTQFSQLFQNLIGNALKFRGETPPLIHVSSSCQDNMWQFVVSDNGIGIDPVYAERIFGLFQRLHTRREYPGTGIGLALCKKIVERHGGRIWLESEPGCGAIFYFTLPKHPLQLG